MAWRVGVDSGGTFTDVCLFDDETGRVGVWKVPSTPDDPSRGIAGGVAEAIARAPSEPGKVYVVNLSGRGDKDTDIYRENLPELDAADTNPTTF